ncbi:MAG: FHA domain-containing protein [Chloroflexi bacterium]|nr:FHA domain-containing protein [Chloroflexota bacterium]
MTAQETVVSQPRAGGVLRIKEGSQAGATFPLSEEPVIIGREQGVAILLDDEESSRRHAQISWEVGQFIITDMGSTNGTFVNGTKIAAPHMLRPDDEIMVGKTTLVFQVTETPVTFAVEAPATEAPATEPAETEEFVAEAPQAEAPKAEAPAPAGDVIPSRLVLSTAEETNQRLGHENLGFLSDSHGFMPIRPPRLELPPAYQAWDVMVERLPELYRTLTLRQTFDEMPELSAASSDLPDEYLLRASALLSIFAHAYYRVEPDPPAAIPDCIQRPRAEVTRRLGRPGPVLSYIDLIVYNWKLIDPNRDDPVRVENMRLLIPTVDNVVERIFYLGQVEILSQLNPIIGAVVRAQEAAHQNDVEALKVELRIVTDSLHNATYDSLMKIKLNPHSGPYFVDPVVWAKAVGPLAVSYEEGVPGPSGIASPIFHLLDEFFGRRTYDTKLGHEMTFVRDWYPQHWKDFLEAVGQVSVPDYVANHRNKTLKGIFQETRQAYMADTGFLGRHRLKVYGYLETAFKVGRSVTIGSFSGKFKDRAWNEVATQLDNSRAERQSGFPQFSHYANVKQVNTTRAEGDEWVKQVVLDVAGTGIRYQPGDRCAILPENAGGLVEKTLHALRARGNEPIRLNAEWREAVGLREGYEATETLPLRTLLTFGRIRPVDRPVAKALHSISHNETLGRIIEARAEDQWELWDLLGVLNEAGFDPKRLWKAHPGERESMCWIVPPESFRMYSISSVMKDGQLEGASEIRLTIGRLRYQTSETDVSTPSQRLGTASNFLGDTSTVSPEDMGRVSLRAVHPPRFSLPQDERSPIVMFAGGTGIAPFLSFIHARAQQEDAGESWLFYATRTRADFYFQEELEQIASKGRLHVRPAFSRDDVDTKFESNGDGAHFVFEPGQKRYIGDEMLREENAGLLWDLLRSKEEGGQGAYFYVCGRTGFAVAVADGIQAVMRRFSEGSEQEKERAAKEMLHRLVGEDRYMQDIFTTYTGSQMQQQQTYDASEVALHNDEGNGYWMIVSGRVYDLTEFAHMHPGGLKIIHEYTGMDATDAYQKILHHVNPEVDSMLGMYEIGAIRRLDLGMEWGVAVGPDGLQVITLADAFRLWMRFLHFVVELENSLRNDFSILQEPTTRDEAPTSRSPFKTQLVLQSYQRFAKQYVADLMGESLETLWAITSGLCAQDEDVRWIRQEVAAIQQSEEAQTVERLTDNLAGLLETVVQQNADPADPAVSPLGAYCDLLEVEDKRFMHEMKLALRAGVQVFEELERETISQGGDRLLNACRAIPGVLKAYYARVISGVQALDK